jgi:hypothetical protein
MPALPVSLALGNDSLACWPKRGQGMASLGAGRKFRLGSPKGARDRADEGRSDLGHSVTLLAALETRSALGVALFRLPRAFPLSPLHSLSMGIV